MNRKLCIKLSLFVLVSIGVSPHADLVYVSNEKDNSISVIDSKSLEVVKTLEVGKRPRGITFSKDFEYLYICASDDDAVQIMEVSSGKLISNLPSGEDPEQFALHPNNKTLYIANEDDAVVTVVDIPSKSVVTQIEVGVEPEGMAVSPDGKYVLATSETSNFVHWIDTKTNEIVENSLVEQRPRHIEFTEDGKLVWVSSEIGGTVNVFDVQTKERLQTIKFAIKGLRKDKIQPVGIKLDDKQNKAYVALGPANRVAVIDTNTYEVLDYILTGARVWHLGFAEKNSLLFTSNGVSGDVTVIDVKKQKAIKTIKVGRYPWGIATLPQ